MDEALVRKLLRTLDGVLPESPSIRAVAGQRIVGKFYGATITTALQPLRDPATNQILAYEALARSYSATGAGLSPWGLFADASSDEHLLALDRICRTVHALNYRVGGLSETGAKLVLNVHERLLHSVVGTHGAFFRQVLELIQIPLPNIVIDIPLLTNVDVHWLKRVVENYQRAGFEVAIAVSSAVQAMLFAKLIQPNWIRLPHALSVSVTVAELHALGVKVIASFVENAEIHQACLNAGVDLVQGFHLGEPFEAN